MIDDKNNIPVKEEDSEIVPVRLTKALNVDSALKIVNFQKKIKEIEREIMTTFANTIKPF